MLKRYNIIVATGSWVLTVSSVVPLLLVAALIRQLRPAAASSSSSDAADSAEWAQVAESLSGSSSATGDWIQWTNGQPIARKQPLSVVLDRKLRLLYETLQLRDQHRVVVQVALVVCVLFALVMIGYGSFALHFLLTIRFDYVIFPAYALLYCGLTLLIATAYGFWASNSHIRQAVKLHYAVFIPLIALAVTASAALSLGLIPRAGKSTCLPHAIIHN